MATHISASHTSANETGTAVSRTSVAVNAGDGILVFSKWEGGDATDTISDNASGGSNSYTGGTKTTANSNSYGRCHYAIAKASETLTITQTLSTSRVYRRIHVLVARPAAGTTFAFDNESTGSGTGTNNSAGTYTVAGGGGYAYLGIAEYSEASYTPGSGWTEAIDSYSYSSYRILTNETSITANATSSSSQAYAACSITLKEVSGSATALPRRAIDGPIYGSLRGSVR